MDSDSAVALVSAIGGVIIALTPIILRFMKAQGLVIDTQTEALIRDAAREGVYFAEEYARKRPRTSQEKLALATLHAQKLLASHGIVTRADAIGERVEAQLQAAFPGRPGATQSRLEIPPELK